MEEVNDKTDVVVVGAGPAGATAAALIARQGLSVLLVDKKVFPRDKVCGCCLSATAVATLKQLGLGHLIEDLGAVRLRELQVWAGGKSVRIPLLESFSVSRRSFDDALVASAIAGGAKFLPEVHAVVDNLLSDGVSIALTQGTETRYVQCKVVVAADGLGGTSVNRFSRLRPQVEPASKVGLGAVLEYAPAFYDNDSINMAYSPLGYCGIVRLEDRRFDIAAAVSADVLKQFHDAPRAVAAILDYAQVPVPESIHSSNWVGTQALTRSRKKVASERVFVIGDSASYVEPFTGEGIAWALSSAMYAAPLVVQSCRRWNSELAETWNRTYVAEIGKLQSKTKVVTQMLRAPLLSEGLLWAFNRAPQLVPPITEYFIKPPSTGDCGWSRSLQD